MFFIPIIALMVGIVISFSNGNRKLPLVMLILAIGLFFLPIGVFKIAAFAIMAAIVWIANKADM